MVKNLKVVQQRVRDLLTEYAKINQIVVDISSAGGQALLVGGAVRDLFLGLSPKDIDIEVYGLTLNQLQKILKNFGPVSLVGKTFGVLRVNGLDVDWSLPRKDSRGRKPLVTVDPFMSFDDAFRRRDLTINALGINLKTLALIDPYGGRRDLRLKILRAPDKKLFVEDPLRFFRVMQFVGRFGMTPDRDLNHLCATMDLSGISRERIEEEFKKLFCKSTRPAFGIDWLQKIGKLKDILPEVYDLIGVKQDKKYHPEGDVYVHTLQVLDAAAGIPAQNDRERILFCWTALCHDLGKAVTTKQWPDGRISSHEHEVAGIVPAKKLLKRFTRDRELVAGVCKLIKHHMQPGQFIKSHAKAAAYKRLALALAPEITIELLAQFACADKRGRNTKGMQPLRTGCRSELLFARRARKLAVAKEPEKPVLLGRDLLGEVAPGPRMGALLKRAYEIQLKDGIKNKKILKKRILT